MRFGMIAAAAAALVCAGQASAQQMVRIDFSPSTDRESAFTFDVLLNPTPISFDFSGFNVAITNGSGRYLGVTSERFYYQSYEGGFGKFGSSQMFVGNRQVPIIFLTGTYRLISGNTGQYAGDAVLYAVPEPATWGMMIIGAAIVGGAARRRRMIADRQRLKHRPA